MIVVLSFCGLLLRFVWMLVDVSDRGWNDRIRTYTEQTNVRYPSGYVYYIIYIYNVYEYNGSHSIRIGQDSIQFWWLTDRTVGRSDLPSC
jgi:hypothetical protein